MTRNWLVTCIIGAAMMFAMLETGCEGTGEFQTPGKYECSARTPGYEDLPVYLIDSETADIVVYRRIDGDMQFTLTTMDGERVTMLSSTPPGYYCVIVEAA